MVYSTIYLVRDTHQCLQLKWKGGGKTVYKWKKKWCKKCRCGPKQIRRIRNRLLCQEESLLFRIVPGKDASGQYYTCFHIFLFLEISSFAFVCKHLTDIQKLTCGCMESRVVMLVRLVRLQIMSKYNWIVCCTSTTDWAEQRWFFFFLHPECALNWIRRNNFFGNNQRVFAAGNWICMHCRWTN